MTRDELAKRLDKRRCCSTVVERVLRLNPNGVVDGEQPRGFHHKQQDRQSRWWHGYVGKGEFIRKFGREKWDLMPAAEKIRFGRRQYVRQEAVEDALWALPLDHPERMATGHKT